MIANDDIIKQQSLTATPKFAPGIARPFGIVEANYVKVDETKLAGIIFQLGRPLRGITGYPSISEIKDGDKKMVSYSADIGIKKSLFGAPALKASAH